LPVDIESTSKVLAQSDVVSPSLRSSSLQSQLHWGPAGCSHTGDKMSDEADWAALEHSFLTTTQELRVDDLLWPDQSVLSSAQFFCQPFPPQTFETQKESPPLPFDLSPVPSSTEGEPPTKAGARKSGRAGGARFTTACDACKLRRVKCEMVEGQAFCKKCHERGIRCASSMSTSRWGCVPCRSFEH
jgi:hypothetical protein